MEKQVWKFKILPRIPIEIKKDARILHCDILGNEIFIWALVNPENKNVKRYIVVFGTGHSVNDGFDNYIGTVSDGVFVFHLFDYGERKDGK